MKENKLKLILLMVVSPWLLLTLLHFYSARWTAELLTCRYVIWQIWNCRQLPLIIPPKSFTENDDEDLQSWWRRQDRRKENIREVCEKFGHFAHIRKKVPVSQIMYEEKHKLLYCRNAKVGWWWMSAGTSNICCVNNYYRVPRPHSSSVYSIQWLIVRSSIKFGV